MKKWVPVRGLVLLLLARVATPLMADTIYLVISQDKITFDDDTTPIDGKYTITNKTTDAKYTGSATAGLGTTSVNPADYTGGFNNFEMTLGGQTWDWSVKIDASSLPTDADPVKIHILSLQEQSAATATPEPSSVLLLASGLMAMALVMRKPLASGVRQLLSEGTSSTFLPG